MVARTEAAANPLEAQTSFEQHPPTSKTRASKYEAMDNLNKKGLYPNLLAHAESNGTESNAFIESNNVQMQGKSRACVASATSAGFQKATSAPCKVQHRKTVFHWH